MSEPEEKRAPGLLREIVAIKRAEWPLAIVMFSYFFLVVTTFWILKPIKKALFIATYDASGIELFGTHLSASRAELVAKVLNVFAALVAAGLFTLLSRRLRRERLTYIFSALFIAGFVFFAQALQQPSTVTVWSFYLFGDLYSTVMLATFFAFIHDSVLPDEAKRLYGVIGLGGVVGGSVGSMVVRARIDALAPHQWMWLCLGLAILIVFVGAYAGALVRREGRSSSIPGSHSAYRELRLSDALAGAKLVRRSRYLLAIVAMVALYEMVSTLMDFQFTSAVAQFLDGDAIGAHFATVYAITNFVALVLQLFVVSAVMQRFGITAALMFLPVAAMIGSLGFLAVPTLLMGSALNTADGAFFYSIHQTSKEALYVPTTQEEKYAAKAFIDMFMQRVAKVFAIALSLGITAVFTSYDAVRWLSLATVVLLVVWVFAARYAGGRFKALARGERESFVHERVESETR